MLSFSGSDSFPESLPQLSYNCCTWVRVHCPEGMLQLGISGDASSFSCFSFMVECFPECVAASQPHMVVYLGIFCLFGATYISRKTKNFLANRAWSILHAAPISVHTSVVPDVPDLTRFNRSTVQSTDISKKVLGAFFGKQKRSKKGNYEKERERGGACVCVWQKK